MFVARAVAVFVFVLCGLLVGAVLFVAWQGVPPEPTEAKSEFRLEAAMSEAPRLETLMNQLRPFAKVVGAEFERLDRACQRLTGLVRAVRKDRLVCALGAKRRPRLAKAEARDENVLVMDGAYGEVAVNYSAPRPTQRLRNELLDAAVGLRNEAIAALGEMQVGLSFRKALDDTREFGSVAGKSETSSLAERIVSAGVDARGRSDLGWLIAKLEPDIRSELDKLLRLLRKACVAQKHRLGLTVEFVYDGYYSPLYFTQ